MAHVRLWDFWAGRYARLWVQKWVLGPTRNLLIDRIRQFSPSPARILDIGGGIGQLASRMAEDCPEARITSIDISPKMVERAKEEAAHERISFQLGELWNQDGSYDLITSTHSFPYIHPQSRALEKIHGLLNPGGKCIVVMAHVDTLYDALLMGIVAITTWDMGYVSHRKFITMAEAAGFTLGETIRIRPKFFLPSIYYSELLRSESLHENDLQGGAPQGETEAPIRDKLRA